MNGRSLRAGGLAAVGLAGFYMAIVRLASGSTSHLVDQMRADWYFLLLIVGGFATQVALLVELRHRHRLQHDAALAAGAGTGASAAGMVACCAHHLADLAPFIGATGAASFLTSYRVAFMVVGIGVNAVGVYVSAHRLRATSRPQHPGGAPRWLHA